MDNVLCVEDNALCRPELKNSSCEVDALKPSAHLEGASIFQCSTEFGAPTDQPSLEDHAVRSAF